MQLQFDHTYINTESGKRLHRQQVKTTLAAGLKQGSRLFYIRDKNTGYLFLVDTGAQISVIPPDPKKKPPSLRKRLFTHFHNLSHPGRRATTKLISNRFVWPNMHTDIKNWTQTCLSCQKSKTNRHTKSPPGQFKKPDGRFTNLHIDIVGPLPIANDCQYILTIIDRFTR